MRKYRLKIGLDVDDVLYECNSFALDLLREKYGDDPALDVNNIRSWGLQGDISDERIHFFSDPEFVARQPLFKGAQRFVRELSDMADVFFVTSVPPECMSARAKRLMEDFPEVPKGNILIGTRKDLVNIDILLDDAAHNISSSPATYPVLMRRPWNTSLSGLLSVNSYSDFLHMAKIIGKSFLEKTPNLRKGGVLCLVGPSGTGKNEIAARLSEDARFAKPLTTTTKPDNGKDGSSRYVSQEQFLKEKAANKCFETTVYSNYYFGTSESEIEKIVRKGQVAVIPIDICGAMTLKNRYRSRSALVFTDRDKEKILTNLLHRPIPDEAKVSRILSLDFEFRNLEFCDFSVRVDEGLDKCYETILKELKFT